MFVCPISTRKKNVLRKMEATQCWNTLDFLKDLNDWTVTENSVQIFQNCPQMFFSNTAFKLPMANYSHTKGFWHWHHDFQIVDCTDMQWAAVSTQQDSIRMPPHVWLKAESWPGLVCRDTCQGWAPGWDFIPPKILAAGPGWGFPHWENSATGVELPVAGTVVP